MTEKPSIDEKSESLDAQRELLFQARKRGLLTLGVTAIIAIVAISYVRGCSGDLPGSGTCKTSKDCDGVIGVECLHAPTSTYCTHTCNHNEDCDDGFHCESPPWEQSSTRLLCLKNIAPPAK